MNNANAFIPKAKTHYRMLKLANGSVAFSASPGKSLVTMADVEEVVELEVTEQDWHELRTQARAKNLDFAAVKQALNKPPKPDKDKPIDTM